MNPLRRCLNSLALGACLGAAVLSAADNPSEVGEAIRQAPTTRLGDAADRHEGTFWAAERAVNMLAIIPESAAMAEALDEAVVHVYHDINNGALLDPERRGRDPARDLEALAVLDLVHEWLAQIASQVVLNGKRDPQDVPFPDQGVVLRFLERARLPAVDDFSRHVRLIGLRFLDRIGFSEAVLGRLTFAQLPELTITWSQYEAGERTVDPETGLAGEHAARISAVAQELHARTQAVGGAFHSLGDALEIGGPAASGSATSVVLRALRPGVSVAVPTVLPLEPPPPSESEETSGTNLLLGVLIFGVVGWIAKDTFAPAAIDELPEADLASETLPVPEAIPSPVGDLGEIVEAAQAMTVVAESTDAVMSDAADVLSGSSGAPRVAAGEKLPAWLAAALAKPLGGRYTELKMIGAGGMGTVVAARDERLGRQVAVKVPPPHLATHAEFRERFLREARALASLDHPGIVRIHDVPDVPPGECPVMIMEYVEGTDLLEHVKEAGCPQLSEASQWMIQAAAGLDHVHAQGICHRDVKPANLMLSKGRIKILDFGLAAAADHQKLTADGAMVGSLPYMPPEQLAGQVVDHLADQYALAVTAFWLLGGQLPFENDDGMRLRPKSLSGLRDGLSPKLDEVFAKALHPEAAERYSSCAEFARELLRAGQGL